MLSVDRFELVVLEPRWNAWNAHPSQQPQQPESAINFQHSAPAGMWA